MSTSEHGLLMQSFMSVLKPKKSATVTPITLAHLVGIVDRDFQ